jgi:ring-1,2-phenylacetyl-CoA epoxidase subunit PaaD
MVTDEQRAIAATALAADAAHRTASPADLTRAWALLATVPDPEIPMVSVIELGIVRDVRVEAHGIVVVVTPTYSGCPATDVITRTIVETLAAAGFASPRVENRLSPPWTTDWLSPEGKRKLAAFGIAPPGAAAPRIDVAGISPLRRANVVVPCPRCASTRTRLLSQFGSTACKAQYRCDACLEPFDYFKPH